jgi:hypothetical protein
MLKEENYYQDTKYFSNSMISEYLQCSAKAEAKRKGEWQENGFKLPFAMGHYFESLLNEDSERVMASDEYKAMLLNKPTKNGQTPNAYKKTCDAMFNRCSQNKLFMRFNEGENEKIFTGEIHGVLFKCKVDVINVDGGYFTDTKTTKASLKTMIDDEGNVILDPNDFDWKDGVGKVPFYEHFDYIMQLAIYQELIFQNTGKKLQPILNAVSKVKPHRFQTLFIAKDDYRLSEKIQDLLTIVDEISRIREGVEPVKRCEKSTCEYCNSTFDPQLPIMI